MIGEREREDFLISLLLKIFYKCIRKKIIL